MTKETIFTKLFQFSIPTFYAWKKQSRPIISLINSYFTKEELEEFLVHGSIARDDKHKKYYLLSIQRAAIKKEILEDQRKDL